VFILLILNSIITSCSKYKDYEFLDYNQYIEHEYETFIDYRDSQSYKFIDIGTQYWMAENLNYNSENSVSFKYNSYGRLYNWESSINACPNGWHLPSDSEWDVLITYLGGDSIAGGKMKAIGTEQWITSTDNGVTNESGFTALPSGHCTKNGLYQNSGYNTYFWSSTTGDSCIYAYTRKLSAASIEIYRGSMSSKSNLFSVRCIKD